MIVRTSNLAMRFYKKDGWTDDVLVSLIDRDSHSAGFKYFDDADPYWIPEVGTKLNIDSLMKLVTEVKRGFNDYPLQSDREHLESKNW